jgi:hypothetical protein
MLLACVIISGCDPGCAYAPLDASNRIVARWFETIEGVSISAGHLQILDGENYASYGIDVVNNTERIVKLSGATLTTSGQTMRAEINERSPRSFAPGQSSPVYLICRFDKLAQASETLGETMVWTVHLRVGEKDNDVSITLKRN